MTISDLIFLHRTGQLEYLSKFGMGWTTTLSEDFVKSMQERNYTYRIIGE